MKPKKILLIEPDALLATVYSKALRAAGYKVHRESSGQGGVTWADAKKPDLVILELELAGHNGIDFLYEFRSYADWRNVPIIINSYVPPGKFDASRIALRQLGVSRYLYKPATTLDKIVAVAESELAR